jgi:hypothetical protein
MLKGYGGRDSMDARVTELVQAEGSYVASRVSTLNCGSGLGAIRAAKVVGRR